MVDKHVDISKDQKALDVIIKKYDRESNIRAYKGIPYKIVLAILLGFSLFSVYINIFALWDERIKRALFVGIVIFIIYMMYPIRKKGAARVNYMPWYDVILAIVGSGAYIYFVINVDRIINSAGRISQLDVAVGIIGIIILLEACRRSVGLPIVLVVTAFLAFAFLSNISLKKVIYNLFYTTEGVIGTPIQVCSAYIVMFIIFGAFLERSGISKFFIQTANAVAGASSGGPAKVAIVSSALCGMVSGSSVANTVTTGSITIPMMKDVGYESEFSGAVEAAASTGGQIMPPIMGAAAFLMAEMIGVPYSKIVISAILPAVLYFTGIFIMVHLEAKRRGLRGLDKDKIPNFFKTVLHSGYLVLPLIVLIWMIMTGYTMSRAAIFATIAVIAVSMFKSHTRITLDKALDALTVAAKSTASIAVACAVAGIIAGVVTMTGLWHILIKSIVGVAGGNLLIAMFFTMLACIVLGMGVPTTATYIIMATTCAPILVEGMGVNILAAHMFVFYFGIVADITPPVALAAYAGSAIAGAKPMNTAIISSKLAVAAFIVPYIFVINPEMLYVNASITQVIMVSLSSLIGITAVSIGIVGELYGRLHAMLRLLAIGFGLGLLVPGLLSDIIGVVGLIIIIGIQYYVYKNKMDPVVD